MRQFLFKNKPDNCPYCDVRVPKLYMSVVGRKIDRYSVENCPSGILNELTLSKYQLSGRLLAFQMSPVLRISVDLTTCFLFLKRLLKHLLTHL